MAPPHGPDEKTRVYSIATPDERPKTAEPQASASPEGAALRLLSELSATKDLRVACERLVTMIAKDEPAMARIAVFSIDDEAKTFVPLAQAETREGKYKLSKDLVRQALRENRAIAQHVTSGATRIRHVAMPLVNAAMVLYAEIEAQTDFIADTAAVRFDRTMKLVEPRLETLALFRSLDQWVAGTARTIAAAVEAKDTYTSGHSDRVKLYSVALGKSLGLTERELELLSVSALCHDLGKIGVPDAILKKPGMLSSEEFEEMKNHPIIGANIIGHAPGSEAIITGIRSHHERWDGTGYPDALSGEAIPIFARIVAVADAFDAMTSGRSYSGFMSQQEAADGLAEKDDIFDPKVLAGFRTAFQNGDLSMRTGTRVIDLNVILSKAKNL